MILGPMIEKPVLQITSVSTSIYLVSRNCKYIKNMWTNSVIETKYIEGFIEIAISMEIRNV